MEIAMHRTSPRFWNFMARRYSRSKITDQAAYEHKLAVTQGYFTPDMSVLEVGCGTGGTARLHAPHVAQYRATDFSPAMIEIAKERSADGGQANLRFEVAAVEDITVEGAPYDAVLALSVLHLVGDMPGVLRHLHGLLAPGGVLVTSTACLGDAPWFLRAFVVVGRSLRIFPPVQVFRAERLRAALAEAGFEIDYDWEPKPGAARFIVARKR